MPAHMILKMASILVLITGAGIAAPWLLIDTEGTPYRSWTLAATIALFVALVGLLLTGILPLVDEKGYTARIAKLHGYAQTICLSLLTASWLLTAVIYAAWSEHSGWGAAFALLGLLLGYAAHRSLCWLRRATLYHAERSRQSKE